VAWQEWGLKIVSIVVLASTDEKFDLALLEKRVQGTKFAAHNNWLTMRLAGNNNHVSFYKSGKFLVSGIRRLDLINKTVRQVLAVLEASGITVRLKSVSIVNIVMTDFVYLGKSLETLSTILGSNVSYEPEQSPTLVYKDEHGICYLVSNKGKIIITGVKDLNSAIEHIERFKSMIAS
jgi:transcription initiation factor TFIID TATA-box-binding protein